MSALSVRVAVAETGPTLVTLTREIDLASAAVLRRHLLPLPDNDTVVELSGVRLLSAAGLTELVCLRDRLVRTDAVLALVAAMPVVRRILDATRITDTVLLADTVDEAVRLVTGGAGDARRHRPDAPSTHS